MDQNKAIHMFKMMVTTLLLLVLTAFSTSAQYNQKRVEQAVTTPASNGRYISRSALTDSLATLLMLMSNQQDSMRETLRNQKERLKNLEQERNDLTEENKNLKAELNGAMGDNLQSSHTKSILFIFNVIVGVFLLIAMIWMFGRKKSEPLSRYSGNSGGGLSTNSEGYDHKLERIEKLGNLRDKGLLTDDEFNLQKKQILGDRS
jgi:hypothetical protein